MSKLSEKFKYSEINPIIEIRTIECKTCGLKFAASHQTHYVAERLDTTLVDAFDCPQCGCQIVVGERYGRHENWHKTYEKACDAYDKPISKIHERLGFTNDNASVSFTFQNVKSFTRALELIHEFMDRYGCVTLSDFKTSVGESADYNESYIGWDNIIDTKINVDGNGYTLIMPPYNWRVGDGTTK